MNRLNYCIQCVDSVTGKRGTFGYSSRDVNGTYFAITPIFPDLSEFYAYAKDAGWMADPTSAERLADLYMIRREDAV